MHKNTEKILSSSVKIPNLLFSIPQKSALPLVRLNPINICILVQLKHRGQSFHFKMLHFLSFLLSSIYSANDWNVSSSNEYIKGCFPTLPGEMLPAVIQCFFGGKTENYQNTERNKNVILASTWLHVPLREKKRHCASQHHNVIQNSFEM